MERNAKRTAILSLVLDAASMIIGAVILTIFIDEYKSGATRSLIRLTSDYKDTVTLLGIILIGWIFVWFIQMLLIAFKCRRSMQYTNEHVKSIDEQTALGRFVKCGVCNCAVSTEAGSCPRCGESFAPKNIEKRNIGLIYCGQCGSAVNSDKLYCTKCGSKLVD